MGAWGVLRKDIKERRQVAGILNLADGKKVTSIQLLERAWEPDVEGDSNTYGPLRAPMAKSRRGSITGELSEKAPGVLKRMSTKLRNQKEDEEEREQNPALRIKSKWLIDPRVSTFMGPWDLTTMLALVFTALFTPYEVAFMGPPTSFTDRVFVVNRAVDVIFIIDGILQFFLMSSVSDKYGDRWITNQRVLVKNYLTGWFVIDAFSVGVRRAHPRASSALASNSSCSIRHCPQPILNRHVARTPARRMPPRAHASANRTTHANAICT